MKTLAFRIAAALTLCAVGYASESRSREMLREALREYRFVSQEDLRNRSLGRDYERFISNKSAHAPSYWTMRSIERMIALRSRPKDRITVGLMSIADNLGADDVTSGGVSWRDEDRIFGFRSLKKFSYQYKPREFPDKMLTVLDEAFGQPVRIFLTKGLSF